MSGKDLIVTTDRGAVRGVWRGSSAAFLGIPFAEPPVGDLQFSAPVARRPWEGVRDATRPGATAQVASLYDNTTIPEPSTPGDDILNLNVFTPDPGAASLPVLVWIHGGAYTAGCQNSPWYDGGTFNADGVVTVSLGYRLGIPAWLEVPDAPANRGALDWVAGLRWVRDNIAAFGGDPDRVTIAGQSAGGGAVLDLLSMPAAQGLFARAMAISAAVDDQSLAHAFRIAHQLTGKTGFSTADEYSRFDRQQLDDLARSLSDPGRWDDHLALVPYVDGAVIPQPVVPALRSGKGAVPLLIGSTTQEFCDIAPRIPPLSVEQAEAVLVHIGVSPAAAAELSAAYLGRIGEVIGQAVTDVIFRQLVLDVASAHASVAPTWVYEFDWRSRCENRPGLAFHCLDLPFWWNRLDGERVVAATGANPPQGLAAAMHGAMTSFIKGDSPGWAQAAGTDLHARVWQDPPTTACGYENVIDREPHGH